MKKCTNIFKLLFSTMLIGTVAFSTVFTLNAEKAYAEADASGLEDDSVGSWENTEVVDEFGDATGESAIRTVVSGTFSNTATTGSDLLVIAYINFNEFDYCYDLSFQLLEYNDTPATYFSSDSKELKIKVGSYK